MKMLLFNYIVIAGNYCPNLLITGTNKMKKLITLATLVAASLTAQAGTFIYQSEETGKGYELPVECADESYEYAPNGNLICDETSYFPTTCINPSDMTPPPPMETAEPEGDGWGFPLLSTVGKVIIFLDPKPPADAYIECESQGNTQQCTVY